MGLQPVISWEAPSLGSPTSYSVGVRDVTLPPGATSPVSTVIAELTTTPDIMQVQVPPSVLLAGHHYVFSVSSRLSADGTDAPQRFGLPYCYTNTITDLCSP
jgi:hypothetical protein